MNSRPRFSVPTAAAVIIAMSFIIPGFLILVSAGIWWVTGVGPGGQLGVLFAGGVVVSLGVLVYRETVRQIRTNRPQAGKNE